MLDVTSPSSLQYTNERIASCIKISLNTTAVIK